MLTERSWRVAAAWLMVAAWAIFIFFMSANTGDDLSNPEGILGMIRRLIDDVQLMLFGTEVDLASSIAHFAEYAVLGALVYRALALGGRQAGEAASPPAGRSQGLSASRVFYLAVLVASLYGVTDEIHQLFVPGRFCDPVDWAVDTMGAFVGALACRKALGPASAFPQDVQLR